MVRIAHQWFMLFALALLVASYVPAAATPHSAPLLTPKFSSRSTLPTTPIRRMSLPPLDFMPAPQAAQPFEQTLWHAMAQAPGAESAEETLLSSGKAATASSTLCFTVEEYFCAEPGLAVDGDLGWPWLPTAGAPQWWQVDLGYAYDLTTIVVEWNPSYGNPQYNIEGSADGQTYTAIVSSTPASAADSQTTDQVATRARYVRINMTSNLTNGFDPGIWEVEVYGTLSVPKGQDGPTEECPCDPQKDAGDPINTRTGVLWESVTDLSIPGEGPELTWTRSYISDATATITSPLGFGWQHSFGTRLITETQTALGGEPGLAIIRSPKGNLQRFQQLPNGTFLAFPGIYSSLERNPATGVYTQTLRSREQFVFGPDGLLQATRDTQGQAVILTTQSDGKLRIQDQNNTQRYFLVEYNTAKTQILRVSDGTGRDVLYQYNTAGDLVTVTDVMDHNTTYTYQNHLLTAIDNPLNQRVMQTAYDVYSPAGKAISQTLQNGQQLTIAYLPAATVITTTAADSQQEVVEHQYGEDDTITAIVRKDLQDEPTLAEFDYDTQFAPGTVKDGKGNSTVTEYNPQGLPLTMTNALGQQTRIEYDSLSRPITTTDALGRQTISTYDDHNNLIKQTTGITTAFPLGLTTIYTYTTDKLRLADVQTPEGVVTHYDYTISSTGALTARTTRHGYQTTQEQVTREEFDALGRIVAMVIGVGTALERRDIVEYNANNSVSRTVKNYKNGIFDPAFPDEDVETAYGYDALGRQIWVRNTLGYYDITHYNAQGQMDWKLSNVQPISMTLQNQPILPTTPPAYTPTQPDANVATFYAYDGLGRATIVTNTGILSGTLDPVTQTFSSTTTRATHIEYDDYGRPMKTILNYQNGVFDANYPDEDVSTEFVYDETGNVVQQRDTLGRWTFTEYDALNRPVKVTRNYENGIPSTVDAANQSWATTDDTDLVSVTEYRTDGTIARKIDNYVDGTFTSTEPITDRVTLYEYDALSRAITTTLSFDPTPPADPNNPPTDTNRSSVNAYEPLTGRALGARDALGRWSSYQYDVLGRAQTMIQNCRTAAGVPVASGCSAFDPQVPYRNIPTTSHYDGLGRTFETVDALGQITRTSFDDLDRATASTQNYQNGIFDPAHTDEDVTTSKTYNGLGQVLGTTDATGATTHHTYNRLGQLKTVTDPRQRVTTYGYDGVGTLRWTKTPDGRFTVYQLDGLGRTVASIANYSNGSVGANEPADQDLATHTIYDQAGRKSRTIDAAGRVTTFGYDLLDRLIWVQENVRTDCADPALAAQYKPCNVVTQYEYDRIGNRTAIVDANNHRRSFTYDAADRQIKATDALGQITQWVYDPIGRVTKQIDPRGSTHDLTYTYDEADRQTGISAASFATPISSTYDALGRRQSMTDATGTTSFVADALGRPTQVTAPTTGAIGYRYDPRGNRTQLIYPGGSTIDYSYWADGQLHDVKQAGSTLASYGYDAAGRLQNMTTANGTVTAYTFDGADRLSQISTTRTANSALVSQYQYTMDRAGQRTAVSENIEQPNAALQFDGIDDELIGPSLGPWKTIELWVRPNTANQSSKLLGELTSSAGTERWSLELNNGKVQYSTNDPLTGVKSVISTSQGTLAAGTWYHVAVTLGLSGRSIIATVYVNGVAGTGGSVRFQGAGAVLSVGSLGFSGQLDEIRVSTNVRYTGAFTPPTKAFTTDSTTIALIHMDDERGQGAVDSTGHGYTLQLGFTSTVDTSDPAWILSTAPTGESGLHTVRSIAYGYDGLGRLTAAAENPGKTYSYAYDLVGNRTGVWTNGTQVEQRQYTAANQVSTWQYDAAGNLLNDGTTTYGYDALGRLSDFTRGGVQTTNTYNGDSVLVAQSSGGVPTQYTQDLVSPLSQILQTTQGTTSTTFVYGRERLFSTNGATTRTWYGSDALGSVRQTLDNAANVGSTLAYDPWGQPNSEVTIPTFGFTGELQHASTGLVNLRARWYQPQQATFLSRDPFVGYNTQPYSLHPYQYGYSNPVLYTDHSGREVDGPSHDCGQVDSRGYAIPCPNPGPVRPPDTAKECPVAQPPHPIDIGYIEGVTGSIGAIATGAGGLEYVFDLYDFEYGSFWYAGGGASSSIGVGAGPYQGLVWGWSEYDPANRGVHNYNGKTFGLGGSVNLPFKLLSVNGQYFKGATEKDFLRGFTVGASIGVDESPLPFGVAGTATWGYPLSTPQVFHRNGVGTQDLTDAAIFATNILMTPDITPLHVDSFNAGRVWAASQVMINGERWVKLREKRPW